MRGNEGMNKAFALLKYVVLISVLYSHVSDGKVGRLTDIAYVYLRSFPLFRREQHTAIKKFPPLIRSVHPEYSIPKFCFSAVLGLR